MDEYPELERLAIEQAIEQLKIGIEGAKVIITALAWQVALVSPGFLGLLWNVQALADRSRFGPDRFGALFLATEIAFLVSIVISAYAYRLVTQGLGVMHRQYLLNIGNLTIVKQRLAVPQSADALQYQQKFANYDQLMEAYKELKALGANSGGLAACSFWLAVIGYVLMGIILAAFRV